MEFISERVGFVRGEDDLLVRIKASGSQDDRKLWWTRLWIICWLVAGALLLWQTWEAGATDVKLFLMVVLAFWGYFAYATLQAYYFWKYGFETIFIQNGQVMFRRDILKRKGKPVYFRVNQNHPFSQTEGNPGGAFTHIMAFWIPQGGTLQLGTGKNLYRFAQGLKDQEKKALLKLLNQAAKPQKTSGS
jgi:hypothetical protein